MSGDLDALYHVRADSDEPELLVESDNMPRPSMDNFGWTWTVTTNDDGDPTVRAFNYEDEEASSVAVTADFIQGREVTSADIPRRHPGRPDLGRCRGTQPVHRLSPTRRRDRCAMGLEQHQRLHHDQDEVELEEVRWSANDEVLVWKPYDPEDDEIETRRMQRINVSGAAETPSEGLTAVLNVSVGEDRPVYFEQEGSGVHQIVGDRGLSQDEIDDDVRDLSYSG